MPLEEQARIAAESVLRSKYPEEYNRYFREFAVKTVKIARVTTKEVTEDEAEILCRHGWFVLYPGETVGPMPDIDSPFDLSDLEG